MIAQREHVIAACRLAVKEVLGGNETAKETFLGCWNSAFLERWKMKTKKIIAILGCVMLVASLTGCSSLQNLLQDNSTIGGADGPTSVLISEEVSYIEKPEEESAPEEEPEISEFEGLNLNDYEFNFNEFSSNETKPPSNHPDANAPPCCAKPHAAKSPSAPRASYG